MAALGRRDTEEEILRCERDRARGGPRCTTSSGATPPAYKPVTLLNLRTYFGSHTAIRVPRGGWRGYEELVRGCEELVREREG